MSLLQLHHQFIEKGRTIKTDMRAQREINSKSEMDEFVKETVENHPLPEGATWMVCTEESEYFVWTKGS